MENPSDVAIEAPSGQRGTISDILARLERLEIIMVAHLGKEPPALKLRAIIEAASRASGFSVAEICARHRRDQLELAKWRSAAMVLCRHRTDASYPEIGRKFGNRDATTIRTQVENANSQDLRKFFLSIENEL